MPKVIRRNCLFFDYERQAEPAVEVDLKSSYLTILAAESGDQNLIRDLSGDAYITLSDAAGLSIPRNVLKIEFQKSCLFGKRNFGASKLFEAMQRRWPDATQWIKQKRQTETVSGLAHALMRSEAGLIWGKIAPALKNEGIPVLPIHDGLLVPASQAKRVQHKAEQIGGKHFQFHVRFDAK